MGDMKGLGYSSEDWKSNEKRKKKKRFCCCKPSVKVWWQQDSFFFSYIPKMLEFSLPLEIGEMMRKEGKEEDSAMLVRHRTDSATLTFLSVG